MTAALLRILIIQPDIIWNDCSKNLERYSAMLKSYNSEVDLVLLPEMFTTGFITNPEKVMNQGQDETISWMKDIAAKRSCAVAGSLVFSENNNYYNRLLCVHDSSGMELYNKRHLFRMEGEDKRFMSGKLRTISVVKGWRICWQICYDLRFPVWSRNKGDYDLLVYAANWPAKRSDVWNTLLRARAIENQSFVIGVNRVGKDENDISYTGESMVIDPKGNPMNNNEPGTEQLIHAGLNYSELSDFREKFPVFKDADDFNIPV